MANAEAIVYVDVDGVLNVTIRDPGEAPLLLEESNCDIAASVKDTSSLGKQRDTVETLQSVMHRSRSEMVGSRSYRDLACGSQRRCADELVMRLVEILRACGPQRTVVLSSTWRQPNCAKLVADLEADVSEHLGEPFVFDSTTKLVQDSSAAARLSCIGEHLAKVAAERDGCGSLKVVVLDDFHITPLDGWTCQRSTISSPADVEAYLRSCACASNPELSVGVKLVHCYTEWRTDSGLRVQVGSGLTSDFVRAVSDFVSGDRTKAALVHPARRCSGLGGSGRRDKRVLIAL